MIAVLTSDKSSISVFGTVGEQPLAGLVVLTLFFPLVTLLDAEPAFSTAGGTMSVWATLVLSVVLLPDPL